MTLRCDNSSLFGVPWIALFDRDDHHQPAAAGNREPYTFDVRHAGLLHFIPNQSRPEIRTIPAKFRWRSAWRRAENDLVVAVIEPLHLHPRLGALGAGVITRPFAKRSFNLRLIEMDIAFDDDFSIGRNRQTGVFAFDHFERFAADTTDEFIFRNAIGHFNAARQKSQRIVAKRHGDFERLAAGLVFLPLDTTMLTGGNIKSQLILFVDHDTVGAVIDPAFVRVARNINATRSDVTATVFIMPLGGGKLEHVDIALFIDVI